MKQQNLCRLLKSKRIGISIFKFITIFCILLTNHIYSQGVSINTTGAAADASAIFDASTNSQGLLIPRLTTTERDNNISVPAQGLLIYNLDCNNFEYYNGTSWVAVNPISASINISASPNGSICEGTNVTYTATPFNGGSLPHYQWQVNGIDIGSNSANLSYTPTNGDIISCILTSNLPCVIASTVSSNTITAIVNPNPLSSFTPLTGFSNIAIDFTPNVSGASYSWSFQGGTPSSSNIENPSVIWSNSGTYDVSLTVTQNGCSSLTTSQVIISTCISGSQTFNSTGSIQSFIVPVNSCGYLTLEVYGAQGGNGTNGSDGGNGAYVKGNIYVATGSELNILVGERGNDSYAGSGGGGTYVWNVSASNTLLIAAGGGGGGGCGSHLCDGGDGQISTVPSPTSGGTGGIGGTGGNGGIGGGGGNWGGGGGGAGWISDGTMGGTGAQGAQYTGAYGGRNPLGSGAGAGGAGAWYNPVVGGYGGGGGGAGGDNSAGGGGGYNGGGGGGSGSGGGGGGSYYINGTPETGSTSGFKTGNGQVVISW